MTCECGYSTPETGRNGRPLSDARARDVFNRHKCGPRDTYGNVLVEAVCAECEGTWWVRGDRAGRRCKPCANRLGQIARQAEFDKIAVARMLAGTPPARTTRAEREAAVAYLTVRGMSARAIGELTRMSSRTVQRLRNRRAG